MGCGIAYSDKYLDHNSHLTFVVLGDGEIMEGSIWEAAHFASHYQLSNLVAFVDVNKLGQSTILGNKSTLYKARFDSFGWNTLVIDGHDISQIVDSLQKSRLN